MPNSISDLRVALLDQVREYHDLVFKPEPFDPDEATVPVSGKVFGAEEMVSLVDACLDFWLTSGRYADRFEREFAQFMSQRGALLVNSGSSANLLAVACLCAPELGTRALRPGDEVITVAAGFPTTVSPIVQCGLVPVFVDVCVPEYNIDVSLLEDALSSRTRAIMIAHTLGNPFDLGAICDFAARNDLWLVEDCCDAVGAEYDGKLVGTFGDISTTSFYPAHHITMGEGGCVLSDRPLLLKLVESLKN